MTSPGEQPSFFEILGVPRRYHLGEGELEKQFHERSRLHHPDRHMKADGAVRVKSALASAALNEAYRALRDPIKRAEYLLKLHGFQLTDERSGHKVSQAFLVEIMELREELMDAREAGAAGKVAALAATVRKRHEEVLAEVDAGFHRFEAGDEKSLPTVADALVAERYFRRFLDEVEAFEEARHEV